MSTVSISSYRRPSIPRRSSKNRIRALSLHTANCIAQTQGHCSIDEDTKVHDWKEEYSFIREIGRGHFAKVWHVRCCKTNINLAAKVIRRKRGGIDMIKTIQREISILQSLQQSSSSVVRLFEVHETKTDVGVMLEFAKGGCLYKLCNEEKGLSEGYVQQVILQLLSAVSALHQNSIVHLDIKADNLLLREPYPCCDVCLCDFGLAMYLDETKVQRELVGTPDYVAPEIINFEKISTATDMWSVGVTTYFLLTGVSPFMGSSKEDTFINVSRMNIAYPDNLFAEHSPEAVDFIRSLIVKSPSERYAADRICQHDWLKAARATRPSVTSNDSGCEIDGLSMLEQLSIADKPDKCSCGLSELEMMGDVTP